MIPLPIRRSTSLRLAVAWFAPCLLAPASPGESPPAEAGRLTVSDRPFVVAVELEASVAGAGSTPVSVAPEEATDLTVLEAAGHGQVVQRGDTLIRFDEEPLERQVRELERGTAAGEIAVDSARAAFLAAEASAELDLASARRSREESADDLAYFESTGRALREESARQSLKAARFGVESSREELEQLKKMYEADDLTEETEEIILKRATQDLERAESRLVAEEAAHARTFETALPREHKSLQVAAEKARLGAGAAEATVPVTLAKLRNELATAEASHRESLEKLGRLRSDLRQLLVVAPVAGTVFYGHDESGTWPAAAAMAKKLRPGGKVAPHEVAVTIVHADAGIALVAVVPEEKLSTFLQPGAGGTATPKGGGGSAPVKLLALGRTPLPGGGFEARFAFDGEAAPAWLPGRTASVTLDLYRNDDALAVPWKAVRRTGDRVVATVLVDGDRVEREVAVGHRDGDSVEVTGGLEPGDVLILR